MSQITAITPQRNDKTRFNISVDGKFIFAADAETVIKEKLKVGKDLTPKDTDRLKSKNETGLLLNRTFALISRRPHSKKEIEQFLHKKNATDREKEHILNKLEDLKYINDEEFIKWWIDQRQTFRPKGKIALRQELRQKGIDEKLIRRILDKEEEKSINSESSLALSIAQKRLQRYQNLPSLEIKQKLSRFLASRGFEWETIKDVIDSLLKKE